MDYITFFLKKMEGEKNFYLFWNWQQHILHEIFMNAKEVKFVSLRGTNSMNFVRMLATFKIISIAN